MKVLLRIFQFLFAIGLAASLVFVITRFWASAGSCKDIIGVYLCLFLFAYLLLYLYFVYKSYKTAKPIHSVLSIIMGLAYTSFILYLLLKYGE